MSLQTINVPDIGDYQDIPIIEILVTPGQQINIEDSICTLESDKATMEVPSSAAGVVKEILVKLGDKVSQGSAIINIEAGSAPAKENPTPAQQATSNAPTPINSNVDKAQVNDPAVNTAQKPEQPQTNQSSTGQKPPHAGPSVRKLARELGVDLTKVTGSGSKSRILREDINNFVKLSLSSGGSGSSSPASSGGAGLNLLDWPKIDFAKFGEVEVKPLSRIKKISGANLHRNWVVIPHVTQHDEANITDLEAMRKSLAKEAEKAGVRVTMLAFLIKAIVAALKKHPEFNASLEGDNLILKKYFHIGIAVDTPNGLMVPVIRDCDKKGIFEICKDMANISVLAREGKLKPTDMQGGCFTISSLGGIGGHYFTPIINAPEVAILGASRSRINYVPNKNGGFSEKLMLPLSLSYDHRVIDGAGAARFIVTLGSMLTDMRRVLL